MPSSTLQSIAIITGSFLSGASLSMSWFEIPLLIHNLTPTTTASTLSSFTVLQSYADPIFPLTALATTLLHWTHAYRSHMGSNPLWKMYALAGASTLFMVPYSLGVMFPTVRKIEALKLKAEKEKEGGTVDSEEVKGLLKRWNAQHIIRGLMPLVGAVLGVSALVKELGVQV